ncbi:molybdenum cofactor biosynthesis protein MoaE [Novosphingobium lentum]|uniref:molybdenum cofactor biosynthesis protein MoaE n=1 Tax=Novosphingobium lentum TaxID=145287 RepID=UPI0008373AD9|nr:molybdenum cofactor biosynthesis protein MoaE [Novosphingobium lentum]
MPPDIRLLATRFDPVVELARFTAAHPGAGGVVSFLGQVRSGAEDTPVLELELTHYAPLTLAGMDALGDDIAARWALDGLLMVHRVGSLGPGDPIVLVAAAARHRRDAFAAADFAMDHLKARAWFWKRERTAAGWRWIEPRAQDHADLDRW